MFALAAALIYFAYEVSRVSTQIPDILSDSSAAIDNSPTSSRGTPKYRAIFSRNCPEPEAH